MLSSGSHVPDGRNQPCPIQLWRSSSSADSPTGRATAARTGTVCTASGFPRRPLVADRLRAAIGDLHLDPDLQITVYIGLARDQPDHPRTDLHQLLARADAALYEAKTSGRDRVQTG